MDNERIAATLLDLKIAAVRIAEFLEGIDQQEFHDDLKSQSAVIHQLPLIGEATKRLPEEFRAQHADIPWKLMARTRDILIHHYEVVDAQEIWNITQNDLPILIPQIGSILKRLTQ